MVERSATTGFRDPYARVPRPRDAFADPGAQHCFKSPPRVATVRCGLAVAS